MPSTKIKIKSKRSDQSEPLPTVLRFPHSDLLTVRDARKMLRARRDKGSRCPCCGALVKSYRRSIHKHIAESMIEIYRHRRLRWCYIPDIEQRSRDLSFARFWSLIEQRVDEEGNTVAGYWRITRHGQRWLFGKITVPRYAIVFDNQLERLTGQPWSIHDALGHHFDIEEIW